MNRKNEDERILTRPRSVNERTTPPFGHPSFVRRGVLAHEDLSTKYTKRTKRDEGKTTPSFGHPSFVRRGVLRSHIFSSASGTLTAEKHVGLVWLSSLLSRTNRHIVGEFYVPYI